MVKNVLCQKRFEICLFYFYIFIYRSFSIIFRWWNQNQVANLYAAAVEARVQLERKVLMKNLIPAVPVRTGFKKILKIIEKLHHDLVDKKIELFTISRPIFNKYERVRRI